MNFYIATLGCKVNQFESDQISEALEKSGWKRVKDPSRCTPDVIIVNTCAVTSRASYQSRQTFRRMKKRFPNAKIIVTGCDASYEGRKFLEEGAHLVIPQADKGKVPAILTGSTSPLPYPAPPSGRSRAYLKIEDGCERMCSYCIIPHLRGGIKSEPMEKVKRAVKSLFEAGYREIVLVGINIGAYGIDLYGKPVLPELLEAILKETPDGFRIRLSSVEPDLFSEDILDLMDGEKLCRHLHIPLQGTTDKVLKAMGRKYKVEDFKKLVERIKARSEDITIGTDIIVGFPGEDRETFREGLKNLSDMEVDYAHVFVYSPRDGTKSPKQPERDARERSEAVRNLMEEKRLKHMKRAVNKTFTSIVERDGLVVTDNYLKVKVETEEEEGSLVKVRIKDLEGKILLGERVWKS